MPILHSRFSHAAVVAATVAAALAFGTPPEASAAVVFVTDDTTVVSAQPNESRAGWSFVQPGPGQRALLSAPLTDALGATLTAEGVGRAVLVISVVTIQAPGALEVLLLLSPFTEASNATFASQPPMAASGTGVTFSLDKGQLRPYYVDITPLVRQAIAAGRKTLDIGIQPAMSTPSASAVIWSRESGLIVPWTPAIRPFLDITVSEPTLRFFWATGSGNLPCQSTCADANPPATAVADTNGHVCARPDGSRFSSIEYRNRLPVGDTATWSCGGWEGNAGGGSTARGFDWQRIAQCHCSR